MIKYTFLYVLVFVFVFDENEKETIQPQTETNVHVNTEAKERRDRHICKKSVAKRCQIDIFIIYENTGTKAHTNTHA